MRAEDQVRVRHMIDAAEAVGQFVAGRRREELDRDRMLLFAIVRAIEVIGEAAAKVSAETRVASPAIPWGAIVGMRNRLIHGYFDIDTELVWVTATQEVVALLDHLRPLVQDRG
ncbi:MAG: DUF86 domain-containing protein [Proteobacteria bacterium]|nr:DUF86 domain-containing protein [Pseudomonadota bacterium]